jgi:hypothetical protein
MTKKIGKIFEKKEEIAPYFPQSPIVLLISRLVSEVAE